ncbi:MAG: hypothetical protein ACREF4_10070 [Gammaproteobacteria bacterium]
MDEATIRARIRTMVETGVLPCDEPEKTWAGKGGGIHCAACGELIALTEVEFEVDVKGTTLRLHRLCHVWWLEECEPIKGR